MSSYKSSPLVKSRSSHKESPSPSPSSSTFYSSERDTIFQKKQPPNYFTFNEKVVRVFPDMIRRSVPGYTTIVENIGHLAPYFVKENTNLYDLGSALGAVSLVLRQTVTAANCRVIAIDNSSAMVEKSKEYFAIQAMQAESLLPIDVKEADILTETYDNASLVALNFTLQFIPPENRLTLLESIYQGMVTGGVLFLSEKLRFPDEKEDYFINNLHLHFKKAQGYSELEIAQKRQALEEVMIIETFETHKERLLQVGFKKVYLWSHCLNFGSIVAIR